MDVILKKNNRYIQIHEKYKTKKKFAKLVAILFIFMSYMFFVGSAIYLSKYLHHW